MLEPRGHPEISRKSSFKPLMKPRDHAEIRDVTLQTTSMQQLQITSFDCGTFHPIALVILALELNWQTRDHFSD